MKTILTIIAVSFIVFVSCSIPARWVQQLDEWRGHSEDAVYLVYGAPTRSQELSDGRKIVSYDYDHISDGDKITGQISFAIWQGVVEKTAIKGRPHALSGKVKRPGDRELFD